MDAKDLKLIKIKQHFPRPCIKNVFEETKLQMHESGVFFRPGSKIAVAVGSRGISNLAEIVKAVVEVILSQGACPFIIPAMGSHGGGTAEGQRDVLKEYGITEENIHAPVVSSLDVVSLPNPENGFSLYMSKDAYESDGVVIVNRVKLHTDFHGPHESGMMKMCVIGLGKHAQALEIHRFGTYGLRELIPVAARSVIETGKILMGVGIVENAYDETAYIKAVVADKIEQTDAELLKIARENMPSIPLEKLDLLIVDNLGKEKSGTGLDTNIIGRIRIKGQKEPESPNISFIIACSLTDASHGNALGMGLADFITQNFYEKINFPVTYENVMTSTFIERGRIPVVAKNSKQAIDWALRAIGPRSPEEILVARIQSTLEISTLQVSKAALEQIKLSPLWHERSISLLGNFESFIENDGSLSFFDEN